MHELNILGVRAAFSMDAFHLFPQCVLAVIPLMGVCADAAALMCFMGPKTVGAAIGACSWVSQQQWWPCLRLQRWLSHNPGARVGSVLLPESTCAGKEAPMVAPASPLTCPQQWNLASLVGLSLLQVHPRLQLHHTAAPSGCLPAANPSPLPTSDL